MRVIIPAAGKGRRLQPLTNTCPKCLVEVNGKPLLFYLLSNLKHCGVSDVIIVTGYHHEMIESYVHSNPAFPRTTFIHNNQYESSNSIVSISLTMEYWDTDFCIIDSDLLVRYDLLQQLITNIDTVLYVDTSKDLAQIDMRVKAENGRLLNMDYDIPPSETFGEFFGLSRWTPRAAAELKKTINKYIQRNEISVLYEWPIREMARNFYLPLKTCNSSSWFEIDKVSDYLKASDFLKSIEQPKFLP